MSTWASWQQLLYFQSCRMEPKGLSGVLCVLDLGRNVVWRALLASTSVENTSRGVEAWIGHNRDAAPGVPVIG